MAYRRGLVSGARTPPQRYVHDEPEQECRWNGTAHDQGNAQQHLEHPDHGQPLPANVAAQPRRVHPPEYWRDTIAVLAMTICKRVQRGDHMVDADQARPERHFQAVTHRLAVERRGEGLLEIAQAPAFSRLQAVTGHPEQRGDLKGDKEQGKRQQAQQLLQLGIAKAAELSQSGNLTSGSWKIAAGILHPKDPARIDFDVSDYEVTVTAFFPDHPDRFLLVTETIPHPENSDPARQP